jgi:hypothetical protein
MKKLLYAFAIILTSCSHDKLPIAWEQEWNNPTNDERPMQIIHGISVKGPQGIDQVLKPFDSSQIGQTLEYYKSMGLGGVVCNVNFKDYMKSEAKWQDLINGVKSCSKLGLNVWIYDEDGYPSGLAGGIVLEKHPEYEAQELAYDSTAKNPFTFRDAFEFTHATSNVYKVRRQVNIIDKRAIPLFINVTHDEYLKRLAPYFGNTIKAFFTDEPSLMVYKFMKAPNYNKDIPLIDPLNFKKKVLPSVPWCDDLPELYKSRYNEDLSKDYKSLFTGNTERDKTVRHQYWSLIADLVSERYYKPIGEWCSKHNVAFSGHALAEEDFISHVTIEGNLLKDLMNMQIPGLDMLSSRPENIVQWTWSPWMAVSFPYSAAIMNGGRRVMTEISDYSEIVNKQGPAKPEEMYATAAWQAAFGVTDFTLYYGIDNHPGDTFRTYCNYVGRLNAILKKATPDPQVLLYYPINDMMSEYIPASEPPAWNKQSERAKKISGSFGWNGIKMVKMQVPFCLVDHENLEKAELKNGEFIIHDHHFNKLVIPIEVILPESVQKKVDAFKSSGGMILNWEHDSTRLADLKPIYRLSPSYDSICMGSYVREGKRILLLVNVSHKEYTGAISTGEIKHWLALDPLNGNINPLTADKNNIPTMLKPRQAIIFVEN